MTIDEARALATIVKTNPSSSSFPEALLGGLQRRGLIEIDEQLRLHANRDAALQALASHVLHLPAR